jgi:glycerate kinase
VAAEELPVADGGEGTASVLATALGGEWLDARVSDPLGRPRTARFLVTPDGTAVVEAASAIGLELLSADELAPLRASSRGLGELVTAVLAVRPRRMLVALGGTATVDGGAGMCDVVASLAVPTIALCDVRNPLLGPRGAARAFGPQKGATPEEVEALERRLASMADLEPFADLPGAGAAGGLGAALAALGAELRSGAEFVLDAIEFPRRVQGAALVVTGEGIVDATTWEGKAPAAVAALCRVARVRCAVFGGRVLASPPGAELHELSGRPESALVDLVALGERLGRGVLAAG